MTMRHTIIAQNPVEAPVVNRKKILKRKKFKRREPSKKHPSLAEKRSCLFIVTETSLSSSNARKLRDFIGGDVASRIVGRFDQMNQHCQRALDKLQFISYEKHT
jgi:hypothetical protein